MSLDESLGQRFSADLEGEEEDVVDAEESSNEGEGQDEDEQEEQKQEADASGEGASGVPWSCSYNADEVNDNVFEELVLPAVLAQEVQRAWSCFLSSADSREAAGEAIYAVLFDASPSLQSLFKTPRAVMAMRFTNGLHQLICSLHEPRELKVLVETLGFQHLDLEVTVPRVGIFRDAIVELLSAEMEDVMTAQVIRGFRTVLNYVGGSYIYIRTKFADRLKVLSSSWALANNKAVDTPGEEVAERVEAVEGERASCDVGDGAKQAESEKGPDAAKSKSRGKSWSIKMGRGRLSASSKDGGMPPDSRNTSIPQTFNDMFMFNLAVMGMSGQTWMNEILASFDAIVTNVANSYRLTEECDMLSLRIAKYRRNINLSQYQTVMLASLRSLCKEWDSSHELAWSWLWSNVERLIKVSIGKPKAQEAALAHFIQGLDDNVQGVIRREVYSKFFALAPKGQDYFKQSTTRLHFIADKLVAMTLDMYRYPTKMVEDISALGLRHVGYAIPTELFGPFVTACVHVVRTLTEDDAAEEAFRWSLSLVSRILVRVINEGSTIVMRAINANSAKQLKKAVGCAPRGKRALWTLSVQVGTQSISPFMWAIETGSLEAAKAIIVDLLTIRADRDRYYYGMDILFERHPDVMRRLCTDAPALLPTLLDGLVWRSRTTENGRRRVNYYVKHLIVGVEGEFSNAIGWITDNKEPKIVCHPVMALVTDMLWSEVALRSFLLSKAWFLLTILVFSLSHVVLNKTQPDSEGFLSDDVLVLNAVCTGFIYLCSMGQQVKSHAFATVEAIRGKDFFWYKSFAIPAYLGDWQGAASLALTVVLIFTLGFDPLLHCLGSDADHLFAEHCAGADHIRGVYSLLSSAAMLLYFLLITDLSVLSTRVSAYVLVCGWLLPEVLLSLCGMSFFIVGFACAISTLDQADPDFTDIAQSALQLAKIVLGMFSGENYDELQKFPALMFAVASFMVISVVFLLNLLIAQLACAYQAIHLDMVGYARLNRGKIITETMPSVTEARWESFVERLKLDVPVEFGEGDMGLPGGIQVMEPASANITTVDAIRRFGGSTSPDAQWSHEDGYDDEDKFERLEKIIDKAMKRLSKSSGAGGQGLGSGSGSALGSGRSGNSGNDHSGSVDSSNSASK